MKNLLFIFFLFNSLFFLSQSNYNKVYIDGVSMNFSPAEVDTAIIEYYSDKNYELKKTSKYYQFENRANSAAYNYYKKFNDAVSMKMRDELEKEIKLSGLIDTTRNSAFYRPNDLTCNVKVNRCLIHSISYGFTLKQTYQIDVEVSMLNKSDQKVYSYSESYLSQIKKIPSYDKTIKLPNGIETTKLDLLFDTIVQQASKHFFNKTRISDFVSKKENLSPIESNKNSLTNNSTQKPNSENDKQDTTKSKPDPVFTALTLKTNHKVNPSNLDEAFNSVVMIKAGNINCSGIILSMDGYILTSLEILQEDSTKTCEVFLPDGKKFASKIIRKHENAGLLLLKIEGNDFKPLILSPIEKLNLSDEIYAVGSTGSNELGQSISKGIVSGNRTIEKKPFIQLGAKINLWQMGGALFLPDGKVAGMLYAKLTGYGVEGIGFAITSQYVLKALNLVY